jgi:hypothetical protein
LFARNNFSKPRRDFVDTRYIGQAGRKYYTRYKEHIQAIRNISSTSGLSKHILSMAHAYGSITDAMKIVIIEKKKST